MKLRGKVLTILFLSAESLAAAPFSPVPCLYAANTPAKTSGNTTTSSGPGAQVLSPIKRPKMVIPQGCERPFLYRGEVYSVDSPQAQDAATLKYFTEPVPEAFSLLDEYQNNRTKSKISAYTGTLGLLLFAFSGPMGRWFSPRSPNGIQTAAKISGLALAAGGFIYSFTLLRTNEYLIPKAVDAYNKEKPEQPIELQFTAGWSF